MKNIKYMFNTYRKTTKCNIFVLQNSLDITYKDRLSRISFDMFQRLFAEFGCEIVVINDTEDKSDETEIFEEIISMLHCFAMKMYSKRRNVN